MRQKVFDTIQPAKRFDNMLNTFEHLRIKPITRKINFLPFSPSNSFPTDLNQYKVVKNI